MVPAHRVPELFRSWLLRELRLSCVTRPGLLDTHRYTLRGGHEGSLGVVRDRHQRIALGVIGGERAFGDVVATHDEAADMAADALLDGSGEPDDISFFQALFRDVHLVHEQDHPRAEHTTEAV